jgi:hypothetical protein
MLRPESWAVIATAGFGIIAAVFAFARTPREQRLRVRAPTLQERLAQSPPEAKAVIIRADRRRALLRDLPWLLAALPLAAITLWNKATHGEACAELFGIGRQRLLVGSFFYAVPVLVVVASLLTARQAVSVLRGGYWPPLDTPVYTDTLATTGPRARLRAIALLVLLAAALPLLAIGYAQLAQLPNIGKLVLNADAPAAACVAKR